MDGKECKCCRKWKPFSEFYVRADGADGYGRKCRGCTSSENTGRYHASKGKPKPEPEPTGWPLAAEAELTVQLLHLHMRRPYGAQPGALRGAI